MFQHTQTESTTSRIGSYSQVSDDKEQPVAITTGRAEILKGTHRISVDKEQPVAIKTGRAEILKGTHRVSVDKELSVAIKTGRNEILKLTERVSDDKELPVAIKTRSAEILKLTQRVSDDIYIEQPVAIKTGSAKTLELTHKASDDKEQPVAIKRTHTPSSMDIIYQLYPQMVKYIDLDSLVPHFYKNGVLTSRERYYFNNFFKSPTEKIHYLLQYIDGKGEDTVQKFLQALKEEKKHPRHIELCRLLKQNGVNM